MTTYQDIADYLNEHYLLDEEYTVIKHGDYYTITDGGVTNDIYNDCYKSPLYIDAKLSRLLADLLDTPVNQRIKPEIKHNVKPEIKHNVKPVTKESVDTANLVNRLTSADQVIQAINTFLVSARLNPNPIMTIDTNIGRDALNKVLKLYDDYNIRITNQMPLLNPTTFDLLIEPK